MRLSAKDLPNVISSMRLLAVVPIVYLLHEQRLGWALILIAIAGFSDGLDGFLAKRYGWQSRLGGILDPLADKVLLVSCFLVLGSLSLIPWWLVMAAVSRDLLIVGGALVYNFRVETLEAAPTLLSKLNTVLQIAIVVLVVANAGPVSIPPSVIGTLVYACLITIVVSAMQYVWIWSRNAAHKGRRER